MSWLVVLPGQRQPPSAEATVPRMALPAQPLASRPHHLDILPAPATTIIPTSIARSHHDWAGWYVCPALSWSRTAKPSRPSADDTRGFGVHADPNGIQPERLQSWESNSITTAMALMFRSPPFGIGSRNKLNTSRAGSANTIIITRKTPAASRRRHLALADWDYQLPAATSKALMKQPIPTTS